MTSSDRTNGFTLVEVLVALTIVVVGFMAMYGSMMYVVAATTLMQEKTIATWIALDKVTELRLSDELPDEDESSGEMEMADIEWVYQVNVKATESEDIRQVIVQVSPALEPDNVLGRATGAIVKPARENLGPDACPPGQVCE